MVAAGRGANPSTRRAFPDVTSLRRPSSAVNPRSGGEPDDPVQPVAVSQRERRQPELGRPLDQLLRIGRTVQEREVAVTVQFNIVEHQSNVLGMEIFQQ